jgi:hypothetical protein
VGNFSWKKPTLCTVFLNIFIVINILRNILHQFVSIYKIIQYTGCPRRNVPNFGRVFFMLTYTDITQNTYFQIWTVTEIMAREKWGLLAVPNTATRTADRHVTQLMSLKLKLRIEQCAWVYQNAQYWASHDRESCYIGWEQLLVVSDLLLPPQTHLRMVMDPLPETCLLKDYSYI